MTKEDLLYEWNTNRLKERQLSLVWDMADDPRIVIQIRRVCGTVLVSDQIDKHSVKEWLHENIGEAICLSKHVVVHKESGEKWHVRKNEFVPGEDSTNCTGIFSLSCITPYTEESILNFMKLSGLNIDKTRMILKEYSRLGVNNLRDVNLMLMLGHVNYDKYK